MSVTIKSKSDIQKLREAGRIAANALVHAGKVMHPGMTTKQLDKSIHDFIVGCGAVPTFLGYGGFPASACISINNEVIHGIPSEERIIQDGDIVSVDVGAAINGYTGDNAATFAAGRISGEAQKIMDVTKECLCRAIQAAQPGNRLGDIGHAVQSCAESYGFAVVRDYVGHGVGRKLHEDPAVPNYGTQGHGLKLLPGMTLAIEPMINIKGSAVVVRPDGTVLTKSGSLSAHFEHTVAITASGPVILTR